MNILFRNVRGLNMPLKQKEVRKMVRKLRISILCLVETRVKQENFSKIVVSMLPGWEVINNYSAHILGRIWVCWDPGISSLKALDIHEQVITCQVDSVVTGSPWALSVVYGATQGLDRRDLLQRLNFLKFSAGCLP
jgi:exonuclease III